VPAAAQQQKELQTHILVLWLVTSLQAAAQQQKELQTHISVLWLISSMPAAVQQKELQTHILFCGWLAQCQLQRSSTDLALKPLLKPLYGLTQQ
jgi:hypothetical protein